jgi:transposase
VYRGFALGPVIEFNKCCVIRSMTARYALTDAQWDSIKDLLPGRAGSVGAPAQDNRLFVNAVLYRYRAGIPWRDLPERFGDFRVVHLRHMRWSQRGVWQRIFEALAVEADNEYAMIDATIVRAHQHSAGAKKKTTSRPIKPSAAAEEV